jgi:hypothetical protein
MIIPPYEAKIIFANIDAVVHAAETFFQDLAGATVETVGAVCLQHVGSTLIRAHLAPQRDL